MKIFNFVLTLAFLSPVAMAHENGTIKIYDAQKVPQFVSLFKPGELVIDDGIQVTSSTSESAVILNKNLEIVRDYFADEFSMRSWNNNGAVITASVNLHQNTIIDILGKKQNASWNNNRFLFGAGSDKGLDNFEKALDIVAHEYTHAIIQESSKLVYRGQSGALNEHLADVFGSLINQIHNPTANPFLIGSNVLFGRYAKLALALRDMMDPSKGIVPQPAHMKELLLAPFNKYGKNCIPGGDNDNCGVHILSGIPNKMAALVISAIGIEESSKLFFNVMTKRLKKDSDFADYRKALMMECKTLSSDTCDIVNDALNSVGM